MWFPIRMVLLFIAAIGTAGCASLGGQLADRSECCCVVCEVDAPESDILTPTEEVILPREEVAPPPPKEKVATHDGAVRSQIARN